MKFLHELPDVKQLFEVVAKERQVLPMIVEKDYWLMHCLWGLQQQGYEFELKGGTSLSKGFNIIERFSEDIDIQIHPKSSLGVRIGKNHNKPAHVQGRADFFDNVAKALLIPFMQFKRDHHFDDDPGKMRGAGIRGEYASLFTQLEALKSGIVLELGFDQTTPNIPCDISSWAFDKAIELKVDVADNRAKQVKCYCPEYTFVEKLQTISTKYRRQQEQTSMPINFLRHYYDVYQLLAHDRVLEFIGTHAYLAHKIKRFREGDEMDISKNDAFVLSDKTTRALYAKEYEKKSAIYFGEQPSFEAILGRIQKHISRL